MNIINWKFNDKSYEYSNEVQSVEDFAVENNYFNSSNSFQNSYGCDIQSFHLKNSGICSCTITINFFINIIKKLIKDKYFIIPENKDDYYIINKVIESDKDIKYDIDGFINNIKEDKRNLSGLLFKVIYKNPMYKNFNFHYQQQNGERNIELSNLYMYNMNLYYKKEILELRKDLDNYKLRNMKMNILRYKSIINDFDDFKEKQNKIQIRNDFNLEELKKENINLKRILLIVSVVSIISLILKIKN